MQIDLQHAGRNAGSGGATYERGRASWRSGGFVGNASLMGLQVPSDGNGTWQRTPGTALDQRDGRPRKLTPAQERQVFRWVNGKRPDQYGFDFGLWTRQIVKVLLLERFEVSLSLASIGALLARLGLTAQKPLERAYQRDPEARDESHSAQTNPEATSGPGATGFWMPSPWTVSTARSDKRALLTTSCRFFWC